jgi:hypothetical protein
MNSDYDRIKAEVERLNPQDYPRTLEGKLDHLRDVARIVYADMPIQGEFDSRDVFLKRLQKYIRDMYGRDDEIGPGAQLVFGVHFGDHLLKWFRGGRWEYHGNLEPFSVEDLTLRWDDERIGCTIFPVKRVAKFVHDPTDDFISVYFFIEAREAVFEAMKSLEPGEWAHLPNALEFRRVLPD